MLRNTEEMVVHQFESELYSLLSFLLLHIFRVVKKTIISWKRHTELPITSHNHLKEVSLEMKVQSKNFIQEVVTNDDVSQLKEGDKAAHKVRKRPTMIVVPQINVEADFMVAGKEKKDLEEKDVEVEESGYCIVSRKGKSRHVLEDGYQVLTNINGDHKQAFFGVFDGHGGRAAVDFVSEKLGSNIVAAASHMEGVDQMEMAIRAGYLTTDREFRSQDITSGACATTVLLNNGELHASNVGDCRVVLGRNGAATALTRDHCAGSKDERSRIESSGGYVTCNNGIWRVHDTLAVTRAIGDVSMKKWVTAEPETKRLQLTRDCDFLIMASDGLWDKVSNQEAVDVVARHENLMIKSCKDLIDMSVRRGGRDDITIMIVDLNRFIEFNGQNIS